MSDEFLDPNDPLNLLISSTPETMSESSSESPPKWPDLESMLMDTQSTQNDLHCNKFMTDEDIFKAAVDMSFEQGMALDSDPFQFPDFGVNYLNIPGSQLSDFPFSFSSPISDPESSSTATRRLSVGSASTASSLSPSPQHSAPPSSASSHSSSVSPPPSTSQPLPQADLAYPPSPFSLPPGFGNQAPPANPAEEIARRVYQAVGVSLAVPNTHPSQTNDVKPVFPIGNSGLPAQHQLISTNPNNAKLPIPRLSIPEKPVKSIPSSKRSSPSGSPQPEGLAVTPTPPTANAGGRPRTSHTTIERRYRTNLNSRIQSLRMAVPALRVLDKKNSAPNATAAVSISSDKSDVIDERGFIDGVKVARKCSKANVLGKAVEYIRVLKKREARLTKEQEGLKSLISGLVGGPTLLQEWEREWRALFGGPETDEVEGEDLDGGSSDEDEDEDEDGETGRKRKKAKLSAPKEKPLPIKSSNSMDITNGAEQPERRKRGRPRKVVASPAVAEPAQSVALPTNAAQTPAPGQYLLAVFALFSFFNSSPSSWFAASGPYHHTGHVVSPTPPPVDKWGQYQPIIQTLHLLASIAVLLSILIPWLKPVLSYSGTTFNKIKLGAFSPSTNRTHVADRAALLAALAPSIRGSEDEAEALKDALGVNHGIFGIPRLSLGLGLRSVLSGKIVHVKRREESFERQGLEQRAWARLGEITVMESKASALSRWSTYFHMSSHVPTFSASVCDLVTLSLLLYPLSHSRAQSVWDRARRRALAESRAHENIVMQTMTLEQAANALQSSKSKAKRASPLVALSEIILRTRICNEAKSLFVQTVTPDLSCGDETEGRKTFEAARSFGGHLADVAEALERACGGDWVALADGTIEARNEEEEDVLNVLSALSLYRRLFPVTSGKPTIVLTPPPSPGREDPARKMQLKLRRALGAEVFERRVESELDQALEEARDMVVDLLTEGKTC